MRVRSIVPQHDTQDVAAPWLTRSAQRHRHFQPRRGGTPVRHAGLVEVGEHRVGHLGRRPLILIDACLGGQAVELLIVVVESLREVEPAIQGERSGEPGRVEPVVPVRSIFQSLTAYPPPEPGRKRPRPGCSDGNAWSPPTPAKAAPGPGPTSPP